MRNKEVYTLKRCSKNCMWSSGCHAMQFLRKGNKIAVIRGGKGCTYCRQNWTECGCWKVGSGKIIAQFVRRLSHLKIQSISGCRRIERYYKSGIGLSCSAGSAPHLPLRLPLVSHRDGRTLSQRRARRSSMCLPSVFLPPSHFLACIIAYLPRAPRPRRPRAQELQLGGPS